MTTQTENAVMSQTPAPDSAIPVFNIQRAYLKGTSLEMPGAPASFLAHRELSVNLHLDQKHSEVAPGLFEVVLVATLTATDTKEGKVYFLLEIEQAGIFELRNIPAEHMAGLLHVRCPGILQNYLRVQITDTLARATLPPFMMPDIDWNAVMQQAQAEQQAAIDNRIVH